MEPRSAYEMLDEPWEGLGFRVLGPGNRAPQPLLKKGFPADSPSPDAKKGFRV